MFAFNENENLFNELLGTGNVILIIYEHMSRLACIQYTIKYLQFVNIANEYLS